MRINSYTQVPILINKFESKNVYEGPCYLVSNEQVYAIIWWLLEKMHFGYGIRLFLNLQTYRKLSLELKKRLHNSVYTNL